MSDVLQQLAWAAGFFDGEGSIMLRDRVRKELALSIAQIDLVPLERFRQVVGLGKVRGPYYHKRKNHKPYWVFSVNGYQHVQAVVALLWFWLSEPKKMQAERALRDATPYYRKRWLMGKGNARLTLTQATQLRAEHSLARNGRQRVPQGWIAAAAKRYDIKPDTVSSICQGYGYARS